MTKMKKWMFLLVLNFICTQITVFSQQTFLGKGLVKNAQGQPISGATIKVLNTEIGTVTDKYGQFIIQSIPLKFETIEVSAIGYATRIIDLKMNEKDAFVEVQLMKSFLQLDEILISGEKREGQLQKSTFTVSGLNSNDVENYRLWNIEQISGIIPNLYTSNSGDNRNVTSIRGIATTSYDQSVATYVDGVSQFSLDTYIPQLFDIERIEVLRGPQGTLYGRNAMGGVINIITKKPTNKQEGSFDLSFGNYGSQRITASFKTPLIKDKLFLGTAVLYDKTNGYYTNTFNNDHFDRKNYSSGNFYIKYLPSSNWDITLNVKSLLGFNHGPFPLQTGKEEAFNKLYKVDQNQITNMRDASSNASLVVNHNAKGFSISSITAFQSNYRYYKKPIDGDFSTFDIVSIQNDFGKKFNNVKVYTQEFRISSPLSKNSGFRWTTGAYLFSQNNPMKQATYFGKDASLYGLDQTDFSIITTNNGLNKGFAIYGQATIPLTTNLEFSTGIRFDREIRKLNIGESYQAGDFIMPLMNDTSDITRFNAISPKAGLNYRISSHSVTFLNYSRGFRTGGLSQISSDPSTPPLLSYKPEYSNNLELGWKNSLLDGKMILNLCSFITFVNNVQTPTLILPDAITIIKNSGKLISKGIESDIEWLASKSLQFSYHGGITDAKFEQLVLKNGENLKGNRQIFTPAYTSFLAAQYHVTLIPKSNLRFNLRGEWQQLGKQYFDLKNTISQDAYGLFNLKTGVYNKSYSLQFWVRNAFNKKYISYAYDFGGIHLGNPRTIGLTLGLKFN